MYAYCGNDPINRIDPTGHDWWHWAAAATVVVVLAAILVVTAGGAVPAYGAAMAALYGVASSSIKLTVASYAFVGASLAFAGSAMYALGTSSSLDEFAEQGNLGTIINTAGGGIYGAIGGYLSWNEQMKGLDHSWSTERRRYWKAQSKNINSDFYEDSRAMKGLTPSNYVLHHPYGRTGSKIGMYYPVTRQEHAAIHAQYGYGNGNGGYWQYYPFNNWWWFLRSFLICLKNQKRNYLKKFIR